MARRSRAVLRDQVEVVAMDGLTGFKTAATEGVPDAVKVMDPFHVVRPTSEAYDQCRSRVQNDTHGHRGRKLTRSTRPRRPADRRHLLAEKQRGRLTDPSAADEHVQVEATWGIYQRMVAAYREPDRADS